MIETTLGRASLDSLYAVKLADNSLLEQSYRLRYEVYVDEFGWEKENDEQREHDSFDSCSKHIVVVHDSAVVGTARLITCRPLPLELTCWNAVYPQSQFYLYDLKELVEYSRFAAHRDHRNGEVMILLVLGLLAIAEKGHHGHGIAMMSPILPKLLSGLGVEFCLIGDTIEYHGPRAPYYVTTGYTLSSLIPRLKPLYRELRMML